MEAHHLLSLADPEERAPPSVTTRALLLPLHLSQVVVQTVVRVSLLIQQEALPLGELVASPRHSGPSVEEAVVAHQSMVLTTLRVHQVVVEEEVVVQVDMAPSQTSYQIFQPQVLSTRVEGEDPVPPTEVQIYTQLVQKPIDREMVARVELDW